jgi:hypothetical protein
MNEVQNIITTFSKKYEIIANNKAMPTTISHQIALLLIIKVTVIVTPMRAPLNPDVRAMATFLNLTKSAAHKLAITKIPKTKSQFNH